jgi:hypothetical protein
MKCPKCQSSSIRTERRPDGNSVCSECGHSWRTGDPAMGVDPVPGGDAGGSILVQKPPTTDPMHLAYHKPEPEDLPKIQTIRLMYRALVETVMAKCPQGRERQIALTKIEESCMFAIKSIVMQRPVDPAG